MQRVAAYVAAAPPRVSPRMVTTTKTRRWGNGASRVRQAAARMAVPLTKSPREATRSRGVQRPAPQSMVGVERLGGNRRDSPT